MDGSVLHLDTTGEQRDSPSTYGGSIFSLAVSQGEQWVAVSGCGRGLWLLDTWSGEIA